MASQNVPNAKFIKMDMRNLIFPESTFEGIWACASFLHVPKIDAEKTLFEFRRVLKPNGLLYLSVKTGESERLVKKEEYLRGANFFAFYTKEELRGLIKSCKFRNYHRRRKRYLDKCFCIKIILAVLFYLYNISPSSNESNIILNILPTFSGSPVADFI